LTSPKVDIFDNVPVGLPAKTVLTSPITIKKQLKAWIDRE